MSDHNTPFGLLKCEMGFVSKQKSLQRALGEAAEVPGLLRLGGDERTLELEQEVPVTNFCHILVMYHLTSAASELNTVFFLEQRHCPNSIGRIKICYPCIDVEAEMCP